MLEPFGEIYAIRNLINGKIYVGQTTRGVQCRWRAHIKGLGSDRTYPGLKGALKKYGVENFSVEVIDTAASYEELDSKECAWIGTLDSMVPNGYNLKEGGKHAPHSAESRERNRQAQLGKKHTHEAKAKMSAVGKGRVKSPEHLAKISAALQGRRPSDAAMARSREVCTGRKMSDAFKENQRLKHLGKKDSDATREKNHRAENTAPRRRPKSVLPAEPERSRGGPSPSRSANPLQPRQIQSPTHRRPPPPDIKRLGEMGVRLCGSPAVHPHHVCFAHVTLAHLYGQTKMFRPMALRAESFYPHQLLDMSFVVVYPPFVTLHRVLATDTAAELALVVRSRVGGLAELVPVLRTELRTQVELPQRLGDQFHGELGGRHRIVHL